ncbi:related to protein MSH5 [Cephalotrichum gorgonifer]|uniref:Related to protein MSH5 n=1 Tax=Cephalotrichum gorgonifer TaxID=2041049 RepID=A0AAE8MRI4_9PEZI|nr:related to protein MSH5 [Cephalotrichum gorgonifer]
MAWIPRATIGLGLLLLAHAYYSVQEHSSRASRTLTPAAPGTASDSHSIPVDIAIEAVAATLIVCLGLVLDAPALRPIRWRVWAGKVEREGQAGFAAGGDEGSITGAFLGNPFRMLETRPGFVDIRSQRAEFVQWVKDTGVTQS